MTEWVQIPETAAGTAKPPDTWTSFGAVRIDRKTAVIQGENPFHISGSRDDAVHALEEAQ